jgi:hypothetical protein
MSVSVSVPMPASEQALVRALVLALSVRVPLLRRVWVAVRGVPVLVPVPQLALVPVRAPARVPVLVLATS